MSRLRVRVSVGAGSPELYQELLSLDDSARSERLKHLATIGLIYLNRSHQYPVRESQGADFPRPSPSSSGLASVVQKLRLSLEEPASEQRA